jgi:predicted Rossmann fold flavoprotein
VVTAADFEGSSRPAVRRVIGGFDATAAAAFFAEIGVALREEEGGKLFPVSNRARTVLDALVGEARRCGVAIETGKRVLGIGREADGFVLETPEERIAAAKVVLATGGLSLPKTGSDGGGYALAASLGHSLTLRSPALVPLILDDPLPATLAGVSIEAELRVKVDASSPRTFRGSLLFTHFGVSGPVVLDASRHWCQAKEAGKDCTVLASFLPGVDFVSAESWLLAAARDRPSALLRTALVDRLPASVAAALVARVGLDSDVRLGRLDRAHRRSLVSLLTGWPLAVRGSRGYNSAEVTAGGVPLSEVDPRTMASRRCPGLFLVGEMLDVDGRLGGFNFQWAWSSAWAAAGGLAEAL